MDKILGILGTGQLGRMLAQAAHAFNVDCRFLPFGDSSACAGLGEIISGNWQDKDVQEKFLKNVGVVTYEWENVPRELVQLLEKRVEVHPSLLALECTQDRLDEKKFFQKEGIPTAAFFEVNSMEDLAQVEREIGFPYVLKTRRFGYDGKGQAVVHGQGEAEQALESLGGQSLIAEQFVDFRRELSLVAVCHSAGVESYPLVENTHFAGMLRLTEAPALNLDKGLEQQAQEFVEKVRAALQYRGVLCLELFETSQGLVVNEMAPRVHNSGHWTIDGSSKSQFESHVCALLGLPIGKLATKGFNAMVNLIGDIPDLSEAEDFASGKYFVHTYNKECKPGRKVGHVNICGDTPEERESLLVSFEAHFPALFPQSIQL